MIVSPIAVEATGDPLLPDADAQNKNFVLYRDAARDVATKRGIAFVDIFEPTATALAAQPGMQFTINGCHVNEAGDQVIGEALDRAMFGGP